MWHRPVPKAEPESTGLIVTSVDLLVVMQASVISICGILSMKQDSASHLLFLVQGLPVQHIRLGDG